MTKTAAIQYALKEIPNIIPLEEQEIKDLCNQIINTNKTADTIADAFMNILGQEEFTFEFIFKFNELLNKDDNQVQDNRFNKEVRILDRNINSNIETENTPPALVKIDNKDTKTFHKTTHLSSNSYKKADVIPKTNVTRQKNKPSGKKEKLQSLKEIDDVVKLLDITGERKSSSEYQCSCQGRIHPIFEIAPNCLSCGKLICVKEGLNMNNCSFCRSELIPMRERLQLIEALNKEKEDLLSGKENQAKKEREQAKKRPTNVYKISSGMGKNLFSEQDKLFDFIERQQKRERKREELMKNLDNAPKDEVNTPKNEVVDDELQQAQDRLENLLHFQDTSAERTKIIDNASDFDMSHEVGLWGNSRERAMLLKKQQRNLRKWEKIERERNGKSDKYVVNMNIGANGKITMTEVKKNHGNVHTDVDEPLSDLSDEEDKEDLKQIKYHRDELQKEKDIDNLVLQSTVWDYEKDKKQFKKPVYTNSIGNEPVTDNDRSDKSYRSSRVQINIDDDTALEDNILGVL